ncbi:MAG: Mu transposase C-terminal domain-containing protein, partial [Acidimicrobiales bacterium]
ETAYHRRVHSETKATPLERFVAGGPFVIPTLAQLHEAFLWSEQRTVTKTATVSLHGNTFEVDAVLVGRRVECVFDPFDLTTIEVRYQGRAMGAGVARVIGRHTHPMARPEATPAPPSTGIDYLGLLADRHAAELDELAPPTRYSGLAESNDPDQCPGQLMIPDPERDQP